MLMEFQSEDGMNTEGTCALTMTVWVKPTLLRNIKFAQDYSVGRTLGLIDS